MINRYFAASFEEDIRQAWMSKLPAMQQQDGVDLYLAALHWVTMTLTTIGFVGWLVGWLVGRTKHHFFRSY